jgi:2-methylisocitrate lyase-like PEP mutase family enzyme
MNSDIIIIARADSRQTLRFDEAIERLKEAKKIGADIVILEAIQSREECKKVCEIMGDTPVLFSMVGHYAIRSDQIENCWKKFEPKSNQG